MVFDKNGFLEIANNTVSVLYILYLDLVWLLMMEEVE